jgi:hypothetical protein
MRAYCLLNRNLMALDVMALKVLMYIFSKFSVSQLIPIGLILAPTCFVRTCRTPHYCRGCAPLFFDQQVAMQGLNSLRILRANIRFPTHSRLITSALLPTSARLSAKTRKAEGS